MPNNNNLVPIEVKKPFETVQEIENYQIKTSPLSPVARSKVIKKWGGGYVSENRESYGPMYGGDTSSSSNTFSINYSFKHGVDNEKLFFERSRAYSNELKISGSLWKLKDELQKLENGEIRVFKLIRGSYERDRDYEKNVKDDLKDDIKKFEEMVRNGRIEYDGSGREYSQTATAPTINGIY